MFSKFSPLISRLLPRICASAGATALVDSDDELDNKKIRLKNFSNRGLGFLDKDKRMVLVSDCSYKPLGSIFSPEFPRLKGHVWSVFSHATGIRHKAFVPKDKMRVSARGTCWTIFDMNVQIAVTSDVRDVCRPAAWW